jgi:hypothetical protein
MSDKRAKLKGRKGTSSYLGIPHTVLDSEAYLSLGGWSVKLLVDIAAQYKGHNNGDLCAPYSILKSRGWHSPSTLHNAKIELLNTGLILLSRQGGKNRCSLYAITWQPIDECKGKTDIAATKQATNQWKQYRP